ncbi:DUF732 domain-containing protein, partial [Mycobacterium riyadhense]
MITGTASHAGAVATATVILIGAAILRSSAAAADPNQDDQFLASLDQHGIPALENAPSLIAIAHQVCRELDRGKPADGVVEAMTTFAYNNDPSMTQYPRDRLTRTFSRFVSASVQVYCPFHQDKLASFSATAAPGSNQPTHRGAGYTHNAITSECDLQDRPPAADMTNTPASQEWTPIGVVRLPHSIVGGVSVASHYRHGPSDCTAHRDVLAPLIETIPAGETIAPKPPQIPTPLPPPANILIPPRAPAPSQPPRQPPPAPQQPPPPPQE